MTINCPDVSIVVVSWNTLSLLRPCLESVRVNARSVHHEVIVVDNGSSDGSPDMVKQDYPEVRLIQNAENAGFARANNQAIKIAQGRMVFLLNSDAEIMGDALSILIDFLDKHTDVGAVGPRLINPGGHVQASYDLFPLRPWEMAWQRAVDLAWPSNHWTRRSRMASWAAGEPTAVDWLVGAALLVRRAVIEKVGGLDEGYWMYAEDLDWCYRMKKAGWSVFYLPQAQVYHVFRGSSQTSDGRRLKLNYHRQASLVRFYRNHYGPLAALGLRLILARQHLASQLSGER